MRTSDRRVDTLTPWGFLAGDEYVAVHSSVPVLISAPAPRQVETVARRIHAAARPGSYPFTAIDARGLPSGQAALRALSLGWLDSLAGGTLLMTDVDTMSSGAQIGFLAVLERLRASPQNAGVRVISGTTAELFELVVQGRFSAALFYRLNVIHLAYRLEAPAAHHA